jgi:Uncharacterized protein conserved in bacteria (DUF2188)
MPNVFIERAADGTYQVKENGQVISGGHPTQKDAEDAARRIAPNVRPDVERVRDTPKGSPDKWRKE